MRVGQGFDVHAFGPGDAVPLGGVRVPHSRGVVAHSDGDVLLHALVDALLGAAALGDLGTHFPSSDSRWQGAASADFLSYSVDMLRQRGWRIANVDVTVVAERPRLSPHVPAMRARLAELLGLPLDAVSVKSKTTDGLGFTGRGEGIACYAVAMIERNAS